jgi:hypothetical protein
MSNWDGVHEIGSGSSQRPKVPRRGMAFLIQLWLLQTNTIDESPNHAFVMICTEQLLDEAIHLDRLLGGTGDFGRRYGLKHSHGSENYTTPHSADLSVPNTFFLCCLISKDMEAYQQLILKAENFDDAQINTIP